MALAEFGNRIPQLSFEVHRSVEPFGEEIKGVVLIPGSGEFVYATSPVSKSLGRGISEGENVHTRQGGADWSVALDQMQAALPNAKSVSLVVSWFGTDLRAGECRIKPGVDTITKSTAPVAWSVAGVSRADAHVVSEKDGRPAYGGTPSRCVCRRSDCGPQGARHRRCADAVHPDGRSGRQRAARSLQRMRPRSRPIPGDGRITCDPAPGRPGTPDKTATAARQIAHVRRHSGRCRLRHLRRRPSSTPAPTSGRFRRMVLHNAFLAKAAGGVDAFVIGTELRGLTWVRSGAIGLSVRRGACRARGGREKRTRAGHENRLRGRLVEYFGHQPGDGSGDVYFHLDPLWASTGIGAIGIDLYWPLADWRDGSTPPRRPGWCARDLRRRLPACERGGRRGYDWYYASPSDRELQIRTAITDGHGSPWVFRYKDIKSWWLNAHHNRPGGVPSGRRPRGCRSRSRSGSWKSAAPRSTRAPTSRTCSSIRKAPSPHTRISPRRPR